MITQFDLSWIGSYVLGFMNPFDYNVRSVCKKWRDCRARASNVFIHDVSFFQCMNKICPITLRVLKLCEVKLVVKEWISIGLVNLREIEFERCEQDAEEGDDVFRVIFGRCENLERISVDHGIFDYNLPLYIVNNMYLTCLELKNCAFTDLFDYINVLSGLKKLRLEGCDVRNLTFLRNMPELEELDLSRCSDIVGDDEFGWLGQLGRMRKLWMVDCQIKRLDFLGGMVELEELDLGECESVAGGEFGVLGNLVKMRKLCLESCEVSDLNFLKRMVRLEELILDMCNCVSDDQFSVLGGIDGLKVLSLNGCKVEKLGFLRNMVQLEELYLSVCGKVMSDQFMLLEGLINLRQLWLCRSNVESLDFLKKMHLLEGMNLMGCKGIGLDQLVLLGDLKKMKILLMSYCDALNLSFINDMDSLFILQLQLQLHDNELKLKSDDMVKLMNVSSLDEQEWKWCEIDTIQNERVLIRMKYYSTELLHYL